MKIDSLWYRKQFFSYLLLPLSFVYRFFVYVRKLLYQLGYWQTYRFDIPVIIVGNITTGGTGKTPLVIELAKFLKQQGYQPGIVSRGYGGKAQSYPQWVNEDSDPHEVGDEAVLLARQTHCPVVVAPKRIFAVQQLVTKTASDVVLCDDGLQHYALHRDIEIALFDASRKFGNGFCLPAGPLREPKSRLQTVDYVITNGGSNENQYTMNLLPKEIYNLVNPQLLLSSEQINFPVHAVAGIGNPDRFFATLKQLQFNIIEHRFPDHYQFKKNDFAFGDDQIIIMTEKDAVKCKKFAEKNMWVLSVKTQLNVKFLQEFLIDLKNKKIF